MRIQSVLERVLMDIAVVVGGFGSAQKGGAHQTSSAGLVHRVAVLAVVKEGNAKTMFRYIHKLMAACLKFRNVPTGVGVRRALLKPKRTV